MTLRGQDDFVNTGLEVGLLHFKTPIALLTVHEVYIPR